MHIIIILLFLCNYVIASKCNEDINTLLWSSVEGNKESISVIGIQRINILDGLDMCRSLSPMTNNMSLHYCYVETIGIDAFASMYSWCLPTTCTIDVLNDDMSIFNKLLPPPLNITGINIGNIYCDNPKSMGVAGWTVLSGTIVWSILYLLLLSNANFGIKAGWKSLLNKRPSVPRHHHLDSNLSTPLLHTSPVSTTQLFDGWRAISAIFIIILHTCMSFTSNSIIADSPLIIQLISKGFVGQIIFSGLFAVDTFLFLSGFFAFITMNVYQISSRKLILCILKRCLRLWPSLIVIMLWVMFIYPYANSQLLWQQEALSLPCDWKSILKMLFFFNNYWTDSISDICMRHTWYLSVDVQLFIIASVTMWFYTRSRKIGRFLWMGLIIGSIIGSVIDSQNDKSQIGVLQIFYHIYMNSWDRAGCYFVGMFTADIYTHVTFRPISKWYMIILRWMAYLTISFIVLISMSYFHNLQPVISTDNGNNLDLQFTSDWNQISLVAYSSLSHLMIGVSLLCIVISNLTHNGGYIEQIFEWEGWVPISKMSYPLYIIHVYVAHGYFLTLTGIFSLNIANFVYIAFSIISLSMVVTLVEYLLIEYPLSIKSKLIAVLDRSTL
jgi:peptidoglycan/LPS O-acetylase OafA/YrhL